MKMLTRTLLISVTTASLVLPACGGSSGSDSTESGTATADTTIVTGSSESLSADTSLTSAGQADAAPAGDSAPAGDGPAGLDVSAAPVCRIVTTEDLQQLFGDLTFKKPGASSNDCSLFATVETGGFSPSLQIMPMMVPYADHISTQKELGATVEELSDVGDQASWLTFDAAGFQPSRGVVFRKGDVTYQATATFVGVPPADPKVAKAVLVPLAKKFAASRP